MHMQIDLLVEIRLEPEARRTRTHIGKGGLGRLLHHVAEAAGAGHLARPRHDGTLDMKDFPATIVEGQPCHNTDQRGAFTLFKAILLHPEKSMQILSGDIDAPGGRRGLFPAAFTVTAAVPFRVGRLGHAHGGLAAQSGDLPLQRTHAGFPRIETDHIHQRIVGNTQMFRLQPVHFQLAGQQEIPRDADLLDFQIAGQLDNLHAIQQRSGNARQTVGRRDEKDLGQVIAHVKIVIVKGAVLLGIQHFQQSGRGISPEVRRHLVDFIQTEQGIIVSGPLQRRDNLAGQRPHIGTPMPPYLGLIPHSAQRNAHELAPRGLCHGSGQRGLAHAGRPHKTQNRPFQSARQLLHGQIFQNTLLRLFQPEVAAVKQFLGFTDIHVDRLQLVPREIQQPVDIVADHRVFRRGRRHLAQLAYFAQSLFPRLLGHVLFPEALLQFGSLRLRIVFPAHFLVNGLDLLVKIVFALIALHLPAHAVLDGLFQRGDGKFPAQELKHLFQALVPVQDFQHFLLADVIQLEQPHHGVGQAPRFAQTGQGSQLFGIDFLVQLAELVQRLMRGSHQRLAFGISAFNLRKSLKQQTGKRPVSERLLFRKGVPRRAVQPLEQHLDAAVRQTQKLEDLAHHPHGVQVARAGLLHIGFLLRHEKDMLVIAGHGAFNGLDGCVPSHKKRDDGARKHHHFAQRHERQLARGFRLAAYGSGEKRHNCSLKRIRRGNTVTPGHSARPAIRLSEPGACG